MPSFIAKYNARFSKTPIELLVLVYPERPLRGGEHRWAWSRSSPVPLAVVDWSYAGSPRFLENPSRTFAPLWDPGQFVEASP